MKGRGAACITKLTPTWKNKRNWPLQNIFLRTNNKTVPVHRIQGMENRCDVGKRKIHCNMKKNITYIEMILP